jgi:hypothetical protein
MTMPDYTASGTGKVTVFLLHGIYGSSHPGQLTRQTARPTRPVGRRRCA